MIGEQWASLAPSARKRYEILANQDRERYELEMRDRNIPLRKDRGYSGGSKTREGEKVSFHVEIIFRLHIVLSISCASSMILYLNDPFFLIELETGSHFDSMLGVCVQY